MNSTVLLLGPTGTGKELFARALHERSRRHARALVRVNCAARRRPWLKVSSSGTKRGPSPARSQPARAASSWPTAAPSSSTRLVTFRPTSRSSFYASCRKVNSSGSALLDQARGRSRDRRHPPRSRGCGRGRTFRADLYYRLSVYPIHLPSLQQRTEDIPRLVWFFIHRLQGELGRRITKVPQSVMDALQQYSWPGNVRELENVVERAMIASNGETLQLDDTPGSGGWAWRNPPCRTTSMPCSVRTSRRFSHDVVADQRQWQRRRATGCAP